jgi:hypothetical protein
MDSVVAAPLVEGTPQPREFDPYELVVPVAEDVHRHLAGDEAHPDSRATSAARRSGTFFS